MLVAHAGVPPLLLHVLLQHGSCASSVVVLRRLIVVVYEGFYSLHVGQMWCLCVAICGIHVLPQTCSEAAHRTLAQQQQPTTADTLPRAVLRAEADRGSWRDDGCQRQTGYTGVR